MITKITCRYSFEVLDFHCNDFGFTFNIEVSYLDIYKASMVNSLAFSLQSRMNKLFICRGWGGGGGGWW